MSLLVSSAAGCYFTFCAVLHNSATFGLVSSGNGAVIPCMESVSVQLQSHSPPQPHLPVQSSSGLGGLRGTGSVGTGTGDIGALCPEPAPEMLGSVPGAARLSRQAGCWAPGQGTASPIVALGARGGLGAVAAPRAGAAQVPRLGPWGDLRTVTSLEIWSSAARGWRKSRVAGRCSFPQGEGRRCQFLVHQRVQALGQHLEQSKEQGLAPCGLSGACPGLLCAARGVLCLPCRQMAPQVLLRVLCPECAHAQLHSKGITCRITVPCCLGCPEIFFSFLCWLCNFSRVVVLERKDISGLLCLTSIPMLLKLKSHKIHTDEFSRVSLRRPRRMFLMDCHAHIFLTPLMEGRSEGNLAVTSLTFCSHKFGSQEMKHQSIFIKAHWQKMCMMVVDRCEIDSAVSRMKSDSSL